MDTTLLRYDTQFAVWLAVPVFLIIWWWRIKNSTNSGTWVRSQSLLLLSWRAVRNLYPQKIVNLFPGPKPIRHTRHGGTPFGGWGCVLYKAHVSTVMRVSPSTCRVLIMDWQVRGLGLSCLCLWYSRRGLCLCLCVTTPRGFISFSTGGGV